MWAHSHLRPGLHHVNLPILDDTLDVLRHTVQRRLDRHASLGNLGQELGPEALVPDQRVGGVIRVDRLLLVHRYRLVQTRAGVALEVLAVGVGPEYESLPGDLEHHALAGEADNLGRLARCRLFNRKGERAAGVVAHERLAQTHHDLGVELVGLILGGWVDGVDDKRVIRIHDGLHQDAHAKVGVVDADVAQGHKRAIVPLGRPHVGESAPRHVPAVFILGRRDTRVNHRSLDLVEHTRGRGDALDANAARREGPLERRFGGIVDRRDERREVSFDARVDRVVEDVLHGTEWDDHGLGEVDPGRDHPAAEAFVEREGVDSLGAHDTLLELVERDGERAAERNLGELEPLGDVGDRAAGAGAHGYRGGVHDVPHHVVATRDGGGHRLAVELGEAVQDVLVVAGGEEHVHVPGANRRVGEDVDGAGGEHGDGARGDLLVAANLARHQHGWLGELLVHNLPERVHVFNVADGGDGRDDLPRAHVSLRAEQRVEAGEHQRQRKRGAAANHLLGEEVHRPVLDAARDANLSRRGLHLRRDVVGVERHGESHAVHHSLGAESPLSVAVASSLLNPAPLDEREDDVLVRGWEGEREVLHDETGEFHLLLDAVVGLAGALDGAPGDVVEG
mmetsp:Transcript_9942/g.45413  ORF Transcript_9942/g.45413 Transcript_9942/m.45413 type:complete len:622 (-) Transcript_9942:461-2326(-)